MKVSGWGNFPVVDATVGSLEKYLEKPCEKSVIARGLGRSYGDSSLAKNIVSTLRHNHFLKFDEDNGVLKVEAGLALKDLLDVIIPWGWFVPVTPGTKFVTIGGMVASNVHGKNHHCDGSFGNYIKSLTVLTADGAKVVCSSRKNKDLFNATIGGMGLTGIILDVTFSLIKIETSKIKQETVRAGNLKALMNLFENSEEWKYTVAWIDCLASGYQQGRGIFFRGEHALNKEVNSTEFDFKSKSRLTIPFYFPSMTLNNFTIKAFNELYYRMGSKEITEEIVDLDGFFYPLDSILEWNKIYGKKGFIQYQVVIPTDDAYSVLMKILDKISQTGLGSFLAVLKLLGKEDGGLSFPMEGYTLALDFPYSKKAINLLNQLDELVYDAKGRIYLTKDSRMAPKFMRESYPYLEKFKRIKNNIDPDQKFRSLQSDRLKITGNKE